MNLSTQQRVADVESKLMVTRGVRGVGINQETDVCTLVHIRWITNEDLPCSTWNTLQHSAMAYTEKESKKVNTCVCVYIHKLLSWRFMLILSDDGIIATNHDYQQS